LEAVAVVRSGSRLRAAVVIYAIARLPGERPARPAKLRLRVREPAAWLEDLVTAVSAAEGARRVRPAVLLRRFRSACHQDHNEGRDDGQPSHVLNPTAETL